MPRKRFRQLIARHLRRQRRCPVQWNAGFHLGDRSVWFGVNLEGMKYDGWPAARLIEREFSRPLPLTLYRRWVARPDEVTVSWTCDAWRGRARPRIREANLGPVPNRLDRIADRDWADALRAARDCLDPAIGRRRRAPQQE